MKKLVISSLGLGVALVALGSGPAMEDAPGIDLACKPRGTTCRTSFECCSQNCRTVNGVDACH